MARLRRVGTRHGWRRPIGTTAVIIIKKGVRIMATTAEEDVLLHILHNVYSVTGGEVTPSSVSVPTVELKLQFDDNTHRISGFGRIAWGKNKPPKVTSEFVDLLIHGDFGYFPPARKQRDANFPVKTLQINLVGYPNLHWNPRWGIGPQLPIIFHQNAVIPVGSQTGYAAYSYGVPSDPESEISVTDATIRQLLL
ncbi:DUF1842 domain-containing protein [Burkholderia mallei]|nr:DUF1842 domain-containing protein [Burkholderia pseudomallei]PNX01739.1 DUF1842 domain-containing protein [Burkholderia sp. 136(2017)]PNX13726.1 DUF1842 domain-containing protein [Burkholderia sp. 129]PNX28089.1 DUF1842 domain-containing protein [Burkholderia sp. 117]PNX36979.1 DUF1842 domain-containing protein [Burkholderia sp. 137]RKN99271.1 DUF1842 domain-containing protein [Burkholderia mallei]